MIAKGTGELNPGDRVTGMADGEGVCTRAGGLVAILKTCFELIFQMFCLRRHSQDKGGGIAKGNVPEDWNEIEK